MRRPPGFAMRFSESVATSRTDVAFITKAIEGGAAAGVNAGRFALFMEPGFTADRVAAFY